MKKEDREDLFYIIENNLIKKDCILVLDDGRLIFCNDYVMNNSCGKNPVRVGHLSGNIEINYSRFKTFSEGFKFWLLVWGMCRVKEGSDVDADIIATKEYRRNFDIKKLFPQYIELLRYQPTEHNRARLKTLQSKVLKKR